MRLTKLSHQVLIVFVFVVVLCLGVSGWVITALAERIIADSIVAGHQELARRIAEEINLELEDTRPILSQLADSSAVQSMDPTRVAAELVYYRVRFSAIGNLYVADATGQQIARTDDQPLQSVATVLGFQVAREGHELVSDVYFLRDQGSPVLTIYLPVNDGSDVVGVLVAEISLARIQRIVEGLTLLHDGTAMVLAQNGRAVAHSRLAELGELPVLTDAALIDTLLQETVGEQVGYTDELGRTVVGVHAPVRELGWGVIIQMPVEELMSSSLVLRRTMGVALLVSVALAVVLGWVVSYRLTRPLVHLVEATEQVAEGDLDVVVEVKQVNEIGVLASSFNRMVVALRTSRNEIAHLYAEVKALNVGLEQRVIERTGELEALSAENERLFRAEERRAEQFRLINEVGRHITAILAVDDLLWEIARLIKKAMGYYLVGIGLVEGEDVVFQAGAGAIWETAGFQPPRLKVGQEGFTGWVVQTGEPLVVSDVSQDPRYYSLPETGEVRSELVVPLKVQEQVIGVLHAQSDELDAFDQSDYLVLQSLADQAAIAIENARLYEQARRELAERKRAEAALRASEEALKKSYDVLELRVHERTAELEAANAQLRESEEKYRVLVEHSLQGLAIGQGVPPRLVFVNQAVARMLGYTCEELLALSPAETAGLIHREDRAFFFQRFAERLQGLPGRPSDEYRLVRKDGTLCWSDVSASRIEYQGQPAIQGAFVDITERKAAEEALRRRNEELTALNAIATTLAQSIDLDRVLEATLDMTLALMGMDAGCIHLTKANGDLAALSLATQRGFSPKTAAAIRDTAIHAGKGLIGSVVQSGQPVCIADVSGDPQFEVEAMIEEGIQGLAAVPLKSQNRVLGVLSLFGRSPHCPDSQAMVLLAGTGLQIGIAVENAWLAQEAAEVEILRELDRLRSELVANVSHELRTPLGLIKIFCTSLLMEDVTFDREMELKFLRGIEDEVSRLEDLVDNLLDVGRVESGQLRLDRQPIDLNQTVRRVVRSMEAQFAGHYWVDDLAREPLTVHADPKRIEQVLRNLVSNAIKYSPQGGAITLHSYADENEVVVRISDQGIGIPAQELERIFERFYRVDNEVTQRVRGAGLGLAVCRGIVEAHGGHIQVESTTGAGSRFSFSLPRNVVPEFDLGST